MTNRQKRICFVIPKYVTFSTGGAELQVYFLSNEFLKKGWRVEILCSNAGKGTKIKESKYYNPNINYSYYKVVPFFRSLEFFTVFFKLLFTNSSYYYQRTDHAVTGAVALYCKIFSRKMIYAVAHDDELRKNKFANEFKSFRYNNRIKKLIRFIDVKLVDKLLEYGKSKAHYVLTQTHFQQKLFKSTFKKKTYLVRNSFLFRPDSNITKENIILWVANFRGVKQTEMFLRLANELIEGDWKLIMMGDINAEGNGDYYREKVQQVNNSNFKFIGHVSYEESLKWFEKAKILVNTSLQEGFSNTFIQAWIYKTLLISMNVDPDNLISENHYGVITGPKFEQLLEKINFVLNNYDKFRVNIEHAREFAEEEFNISNNFNKISELLINENTAR